VYNPFSLENKTILVTGASSGIGRAIAIECSKMGASVIITGRNEERLKETYSQMEGNQPNYIVADLSNSDDMQNLSKSITLLNGLVNCAGLTKVLPFPFAERKDFEEVMEVNFFAPTELSRLLVKTKKLQKGASIVFISSVSGVYCSAVAGSIYSSSKGCNQRTCKSNGLGFGSQRNTS
jgi:short-subunit dehydrogenase